MMERDETSSWNADDVIWHFMTEEFSGEIDEAVPQQAICHECGPATIPEDGHRWIERSPEIGDECMSCGMRCQDVDFNDD